METGALTYLDTHAVLWMFAGKFDEFSPAALVELEAADLWISPLVLLEIAYLQEIKRIGVGPSEVLSGLKRDAGLKVCPMPFPEVVTASLNEQWTRDVFDRVIVAQAKASTARLISRDRSIRAAYPRTVW